MDDSKKRLQPIYITVIYGLFYTAYTSFMSFLVMYLTGYGYENSLVSLIYSALALISLFAQPFLGYLADSVFPMKKIAITIMVVSIPVTLMLPMAVRIFPLMLIFVLLSAFLNQSLMSLIDSWTYMAKADNEYIIYSRARGMGSLTSAIIAFIVGQAVVAYGLDVIVLFNGVFMALTIIFAFLFTDVPCRNKKREQCDEQAAVKSLSITQAIGVLRKNKKYLYFIGGILLLCIGYRAVVTYLPMMIKSFGGNSSHQGLAVTMLTIAIYPVMFIYPRLIRRFDVNKMLIAGVVCVVLRIFSMAIVPSLNAVIYFQLFEAVAFGLYNPSIIEYVSRITPLQIRSSAITISAAVQVAVSGIIGNLIASLFLQFSNLFVMFGVFTVLGVIGLVLIILSIRTNEVA